MIRLVRNDVSVRSALRNRECVLPPAAHERTRARPDPGDLLAQHAVHTVDPDLHLLECRTIRATIDASNSTDTGDRDDQDDRQPRVFAQYASTMPITIVSGRAIIIVHPARPASALAARRW